MRTPTRRHRLAAATVGILALALLPGVAMATHDLASLPGSTFEIDSDANLKVDDGGKVDWGSLAHPNGPEKRATDVATGQNDDSYKGGVKENTACPGETTGSIPNNKSDLLTFHVHQEAGTGGHPGYLNLAWSRVSDPSGTTLMDFEFNQSTTACTTGPNVIRTPGDLLIEYAIDQGGARAAISGRTWTGTAWGAPVDISANSPICGGGPCAVGTINQNAIPAAESDGLGAKQPRTFGEAQIDLRLIFQEDKCTSFGSAMIKSRSSDSFQSQLKDFIRPVGLTLRNCANVIIRKQTDPDGDTTTTFGFTKSFPTDPATGNTFTLKDDGVKDYGGLVLLGSGYTVEETDDADYDFQGVDCSASSGVTPSSIAGAKVTFALDSASDVLDCTYTNRARGTIIVKKVTTTGNGTFGFTSNTLPAASFDLTTTASGNAGSDSRTFADLTPKAYDVSETVPDGWNLTDASCDDGSEVDEIDLSAGETVTCTFTNDRERGAIRIEKTRKHAADGPGDHPHAGVTFTVTGGNLPAAGVSVQTNAQGKACVDDLLISQFAGDYTVTETVPAGYKLMTPNDVEVTVVESDCTDGVLTQFENMPLTNITVTVDSQVDGGTASEITCDWNGTWPQVTGSNGDKTLTKEDLLPGTYTCEIYVDP